MLQVYVCVGSSCHLKGSPYVIKEIEKLIKKNNIEDKVELKASFCLGYCTGGVSVKVEDEIIKDLTVSNIEEKFNEYIIGRLKNECNTI